MNDTAYLHGPAAPVMGQSVDLFSVTYATEGEASADARRYVEAHGGARVVFKLVPVSLHKRYRRGAEVR